MSLNVENSWKNALKLTSPIFIGYFAAGVPYGMLAINAGMPSWLVILMSFTVFSGTAQYAAIPMFTAAASPLSVLVSTILIHLRFNFYTLNMRPHLPDSRVKKISSVAYLTDEPFGVLSVLPPEARKSLMPKITLLGPIYWTFATIVGVLLGDALSPYIPNLDFALPCLFAILAYEQYRHAKNWKAFAIALICFLLAEQISEQSTLLIAILLAIVAVMLLPMKREEKKQNTEEQARE